MDVLPITHFVTTSEYITYTGDTAPGKLAAVRLHYIWQLTFSC